MLAYVLVLCLAGNYDECAMVTGYETLAECEEDGERVYNSEDMQEMIFNEIGEIEYDCVPAPQRNKVGQ